MNPRTYVSLITVIVALECAVSAAPASTAFIYQGQLQTAGAPTDGLYDFRFTLYDAASGGNPVGSTVSTNAVSVASGLFTVSLDFGSGVLV